MGNPLNSKGIRSWAALIAAYAIVLHSVLGGLVLAQQSALAHGSGAVICYTSGKDASGDEKTSLRHVPCAVCAAAGTIAPPPTDISLPLPSTGGGTALVALPAETPDIARLISPKRSQAPPQTT